MLNKGDLCKHFKGKNLIEKNIYEVLEVNVKYTGENKEINGNLVVYKNIFKDNQIFVREEKDLNCELELEKQIEFNQKHRVEKLTQEEIKQVKTKEFRKSKLNI